MKLGIEYTSSKFENHKKHWENIGGRSDDFSLNLDAGGVQIQKVEWHEVASVLTFSKEEHKVKLLSEIVNACSWLLAYYTGHEQVQLFVNPLENGKQSKALPFINEVELKDTKRDTFDKTKESLKATFQYQDFPVELVDDFSNFSNVLIHFNGLLKTTELDSAIDYIIELGLTTDAITLTYKGKSTKVSEEGLRALDRHLLSILKEVESQVFIDLDLRSKEEHLLYDTVLNQKDIAYSKTTLLELFLEQVQRNGDETAILDSTDSWSYKELNEKSLILAQHLLENNCEPGDFVAVEQVHSNKLIASILAVLRVGACYVPIDPSNPKERKDFIKKDVACKYVLDDEVVNGINKKSLTLPVDYNQAKNEGTAYVIFTSGSTGKPKGVQISHDNVVRLFVNEKSLFSFNEKDVWILLHSFAFDFSVWEIFGAILFGGKLVIPTNEERADLLYVSSLLIKEQVTVLNQTPSSFYSLQSFSNSENRTYESLRYLIFGGEKLDFSKITDWLKRYENRCDTINMYGITETTVHVTYKKLSVQDTDTGISTIGVPIPTLTCEVRNLFGQPMPVGVPGELYVGGAGVANLAYLNRPELTSEKFLVEGENERVYRTGDKVTVLQNGELAYLGRIDDQVKIRGYRIELGEVQNQLNQVASVQDAVVTVEGDVDKQLVGFVTPNKDSIIEKLLAKDDKLPLHTLPNGMSVYYNSLFELEFLYDEIFKDGCYVHPEIKLSNEAIVFDVGANIGMFSLFMNTYAPKMEIYAFEPVDSTFNILKGNTGIYCENTKVFPFGLSNKEEVVTFQKFKNASVLSGLKQDDDGADVKSRVNQFMTNMATEQTEGLEEVVDQRLDSELVECELKRLSSVIRSQNITKIDLLKVDVEKSEINVLKGIDDEHWDKIGQLIVEVHNQSGALSYVQNLLEEKGYRVVVEQDQGLDDTDIYVVYGIHPSYAPKGEIISFDQEIKSLEPMSLDAWKQDVLESVEKTLAAHMIPSDFVLLPKLPINMNGKVDKRKLSALFEESQVRSQAKELPLSKEEVLVASLWEEILGHNNFDVNSRFFEVGGHSLKQVQLITRLKKVAEVQVTVKQLFDNQTVREQALLLKNNKGTSEEIVPVQFDRDNGFEVAPAQRRLWLVCQEGTKSVSYNVPVAIDIEGELDVDVMQSAYKELQLRHEILRSNYALGEDSELKQYLLPESSLPVGFEFVDLSEKGNDEVEQITKENASQPFNFEKDVMCRVHLLKLVSEEYRLLITMHHIISDGWSLNILIRDLLLLYNQEKGENVQLDPIKIQYKDYAHQVREKYSGDAYEKSKVYWLNKFADDVPELQLPLSKKTPAEKRLRGSILITDIDENVFQPFRAFCLSRGASVYDGIMALTNVMLCKYSGQNDIIIGSPNAGREHLEYESIIGLFLNTVALRNTIDTEETFEQFLDRVKENNREAFSNLAYPFESLIEELYQREGWNRGNLFNVWLTLQNLDTVRIPLEKGHSDLTFKHREQDVEHAQFDLVFAFTEKEQGIELALTYDTDMFEKDFVEQLTHNLTYVMKCIPHSEKALKNIEVLGDESKQLLDSFNPPLKPFNSDLSILDKFKLTFDRSPNSVGVVYQDKSLTYSEMDRVSNQFANYLLNEHRVQKGDRVAFQLTRSEMIPVVVLGILKTGACYIPFDIAYPKERTDFLIKDSACSTFITDEELRIFTDQQGGYSEEKIGVKTDPNDVAYVIYTSGTSGKPKGTMIEHRSVVNHIENVVEPLNYKEGGVIMLFPSMGFDAAAEPLFMSLFNGGKLVVKGDDDISYESLIALFNKHEVRYVNFPTGYFTGLAASGELQGLKHKMTSIWTGGDKLDLNFIDKYKDVLVEHTEALFNIYGPTETTIAVTLFNILEANNLKEMRSLPIGKPLGNRKLYIVDEYENLQPVGVPGEILIGGEGVAKGYVNREDLNNEKFRTNPFETSGRVYYTGDKGRWLPDGNIVFDGRVDNQVKIRGYRIELGEVESALNTYEAIKEGVVVTRKVAEQSELVAYFTEREKVTLTEIRAFLKSVLPAFMIPAFFVKLDEFPKTVHNKIDEQALPDPLENKLEAENNYGEPIGHKEVLMAEMWSDVLGIDRVGRNDNFFELGGDSIKSIMVISKLKERGFLIKVKDILANPVLSETVNFLEEVTVTINQGEVTGEVRLSPIQRWFLEKDWDKNHFHQMVLLKSEKPIDKTIVQQCLNRILEHHDALRMKFTSEDGNWKQVNLGTSEVQSDVVVYDLSNETVFEEKLKELCTKEQQWIDSEKSRLFRVVLFKVKEEYRICFIAHHLVVDGVSWRILLDDFENLYLAYDKGEEPQLLAKTTSFKEYQEQMVKTLQSDLEQEELIYWENQISNVDRVHVEGDLSKNTNKSLHHIALNFSVDETDKMIKTLYTKCSAQLKDALMASVSKACETHFDIKNVAFRMEGHGRKELDGVDTSRTIGWFTAMYPMNLGDLSNENWVNRLKKVKDAVRRVPHDGVNYGWLKYNQKRDLSMVTDFTFNYLGEFNGTTGPASYFSHAVEEIGVAVADDNLRDGLIDFTAVVLDKSLQFMVAYSEELFSVESMERLMEDVKANLNELIHNLKELDLKQITPTDLTFSSLTIEEVDELNADGQLEDVYPLSLMQESIYSHWKQKPTADAYREQMSYKVSGMLMPAVFKECFKRLVDRHAILRTSFVNDYAGQPLQLVKTRVEQNFEIVDVSKLGHEEQLKEIEALKKQRLAKLHPENESLIDLVIVKISMKEHFLIWTHHHILMDGWCIAIVNEELRSIYESLLLNKAPELPELTPYSKYIEWLNKQNLEETKQFWSRYLKGFEGSLDLPFKKSNSSLPIEVQHFALNFSQEETEKITHFCANAQVTTNTFVRAAYGILLAKYNAERDVLVPAVYSGRTANIEGVDKILGLFINTLPVRYSWGKGESFTAALSRWEKQNLELEDYSYLTFSEILKFANVDTVDNLFVFQNYPLKDKVGQDQEAANPMMQFQVSEVDFKSETNFNLNMVAGLSDVLTLQFEFNQNVYDQSLLVEFLDNIKGFMLNIVDGQASKSIDELSVVSQSNSENKIVGKSLAFTEKSITAVIDELIQQNSDRIALVHGDDQVSYGQLGEKVEQLAGELKKQGVQKGSRVAIQLEKSPWQIIAICATLRLGASYVPMDVSLPEERKRFILKDAEVRCVVNQEVIDDLLSVHEKVEWVEILPEDEVYVIYTSGTTGVPKGVAVKHESLFNLVESQKQAFDMSANEVLLQFSNLAFDASVEQIFMALTIGAKLIIPKEDILLNTLEMEMLLEKEKVTHFHATPSYLAQFNPKVFASLNRLVAGGESLPLTLLNQWLNFTDVYNEYGPTECTVTCLMHKYEQGQVIEQVMIGKPIANTEAWVANNNLLPTPNGAIGELYIGGKALAKGYVNAVEQTEESFVIHPSTKERFYKTGDYVKTLNDQLYFIGRKDGQIKHRGYRIEIDEIEEVFKNSTGKKVVIRLHQEALVLMATEEVTLEDVEKAGKFLMSYMLPEHCITIQEWPLNANGKMDENELKASINEYLATFDEEVAPPESKTEKSLHVLWETLMGRKIQSIDANFFALGGHSLMAMRLINQVQNEFDVQIEVAKVLEEPTIRRISKEIDHLLYLNSAPEEDEETALII